MGGNSKTFQRRYLSGDFRSPAGNSVAIVVNRLDAGANPRALLREDFVGPERLIRDRITRRLVGLYRAIEHVLQHASGSTKSCAETLPALACQSADDNSCLTRFSAHSS